MENKYKIGFKKMMGPPKPLMQPRERLMVESSYRPMTRKEIMETMPKKGKPASSTMNDSIALNRRLNKEMGAKKKPATKKPVAKKKPKTQAQKLYEKQIKARKKRQKKDPLGRD
jgi:hypothetical protein